MPSIISDTKEVINPHEAKMKIPETDQKSESNFVVCLTIGTRLSNLKSFLAGEADQRISK